MGGEEVVPSFREPFEEMFDITYIRQPWGVDRVKTLVVKPHRRWELRLLANGVPILYCGYARRHARGESGRKAETPISEMPIRPIWQQNAKYDGKYGEDSGFIRGTNIAEG
jgi:hypothetical protein